MCLAMTAVSSTRSATCRRAARRWLARLWMAWLFAWAAGAAAQSPISADPNNAVDLMRLGELHAALDDRVPPDDPRALGAWLAGQPRVHRLRLFGASYRKTVVSENVLAIAALGALVTLAFYNLFMFYGTRDKALLYYSLYLLAATAGWGLTFHIGAQWLGFHELQWHYVGFFLLPVFNGLFFMEFLQLPRLAPGLTMATRANIVLSLALLPSCFIALPFAHALATFVIT